jgi:hypothetical protein
MQKAILEVVQRGKLIDGVSYPYSPSSAGSGNKRLLLPDAMEAVAVALAREWSPDDLKAVTERSIGMMKDTGALVEEEIANGRFRQGRGLRASPEALETADHLDLVATVSEAPPMAPPLDDAGRCRGAGTSGP